MSRIYYKDYFMVRDMGNLPPPIAKLQGQLNEMWALLNANVVLTKRELNVAIDVCMKADKTITDRDAYIEQYFRRVRAPTCNIYFSFGLRQLNTDDLEHHDVNYRLYRIKRLGSN